MIKYIPLITLALFLTPMATAQVPASLPAVNKEAAYFPIYDQRDKILQERLVQEINARPKWKRLVDKKKMSVALVDISNPTQPKYAAVNGETTMYAASLPKIAILLAAFQQIHDGKLEDTTQLRADLNAMIRVSSNRSATKVIDILGGLEAVNQVLISPEYKLYDEARGGGLWVGKRFAKTGPRIGDPMKGISHAANAAQVARFYYLLSTGRLVSPEASRDMFEIMSRPGINHKFVAGLHESVDGSDIFRKSGSWRNFHADSCLVWADDWRHYILVGIVESPNGGAILKELAPVAEKILRTNA